MKEITEIKKIKDSLSIKKEIQEINENKKTRKSW